MELSVRSARRMARGKEINGMPLSPSPFLFSSSGVTVALSNCVINLLIASSYGVLISLHQVWFMNALRALPLQLFGSIWSCPCALMSSDDADSPWLPAWSWTRKTHQRQSTLYGRGSMAVVVLVAFLDLTAGSSPRGKLSHDIFVINLLCSKK